MFCTKKKKIFAWPPYMVLNDTGAAECFVVSIQMLCRETYGTIGASTQSSLLTQLIN